MSDSAPPRTTEEIARLLETMAQGQQDLALARQLREWSRAVAQHQEARLRADAVRIQDELYVTLEDHLIEIKTVLTNLSDVVHDTIVQVQDSASRLDTVETRQHTAAADRSGMRAQIVDLATTLEQIRTRLIDLARDVAARPSIEETAARLDQIDDHERRIDDHEQRITELEGGAGDVAAF